MSRISWTAAACSIALFGAVACAGANSDANMSSGLDAAGSSAQTETQTQAPDAAPPADPATATYTDVQLQAFVAAAAEINPIAQSLTTATPEQRAQSAAQIRAILAQHGLDADTYNAIASRAQTDAAFAARIATLQSTQQTPPPEG